MQFHWKNSLIGYTLEDYLENPDELHPIYNDYLLTPEKLKSSHNMLSNYCSNIPNDYRIKIGNVNKLVPIFGNKNRYALHYKNLL